MKQFENLVSDEILIRLPVVENVSMKHHNLVVFTILSELSSYLSLRSNAPDELKVEFIKLLDKLTEWESDNMGENGLNFHQSSLIIWMNKYQHQINNAIEDEDLKRV
jgi:hypothetical protein